MFRPRRSISTPIVLGVVTVTLSIALLVSWILVIVQNLLLTEKVTQNTWLLALGSVSFVMIIAVLVLFSVFLVRETRTVNRQIRFIDSVTHELKSPLASLKLGLDTLARSDLPEARQADVRRMMVDDVERLSIFIDDVLEASRLSHAPQGHLLAPVALRELVEGHVERIERHYKLASGSVEVDVPDDLVLVTDRTSLEIVLKNLLDNAVKYSVGLDKPVRVAVLAERLPGHVHLQIRDQGVGIPRKDLKRVFERFYRASGEDVRARRGTGLGLYVVSGLVRVLGGRLRAESGGSGCGTVMHVWIPMRSNELPADDDGSAPDDDGSAPDDDGANGKRA